VFVSSAAGNGNTWTFAVRKNGVSTGMTCTVTGTTAVSCNDVTHTVVFLAADTIDLIAAPTSSPSSAVIGWSAKLS
jgi:hypothetical protein